ncbi:MAG: cation diffusion facilitator family transporter [Bacteroidota bacterium]
MNKKISVARLSIASNTLLIILKLIAGIMSGSVSIISEAIHSMMDLLAAIIAYFAVRISDHPADERHPYGHGKYENVSGVIEALLIFIAAIWIIFEAIQKLLTKEPSEFLGVGIIVMFFSAIVNTIVSRRLYKVAKETDSMALEADALHLKTDVLTSLGVAVGLSLIYLTGLQILDPIVAILVALMIIRESYFLLLRAYRPLLDSALDISEIQVIDQILKDNHVEYHGLKTRKSGNYKFVEFHLELDPEAKIIDAHNFCDEIEDLLKTKLDYLTVTIHVEPINH